MKRRTFLLIFLSAAFLAVAGCGLPHQLTISDIQNPSSKFHPAAGTPVTLENVIVTTDLQVRTGYSYFYVEQPEAGPYSGILIYSESIDVSAISRGDAVNLSGIYAVVDNRSRINLTQANVLSKGNALPEAIPVLPESIAPTGPVVAAYEGVLVKVESVIAWASPAPSGGNFTVTQGLQIGGNIYGYPATAGEHFVSITGILARVLEGASGGPTSYRLLPRDSGDIVTEASEVKQVSIYELRDPANPNHPGLEDRVSLLNVIVTAVAQNYFWVQEPAGGAYSGVAIFAGTAEKPRVGDSINLEGTYRPYYSLDSVTLDSFSVVSSGNSLPIPATLDPANLALNTDNLARQYEGVLIRIGSVAVTNVFPDPAPAGEFEVTGGLHVGDQIYLYDRSTLAVGTTFESITGILTYSLCGAGSTPRHKILPRSAEDVKLGI